MITNIMIIIMIMMMINIVMMDERLWGNQPIISSGHSKLLNIQHRHLMHC